MTITGIPENERIWLHRISTKGQDYYITSKASRDTYYLYKVTNNKATLVGEAPTPIELEKKYIK